MLASHGQIAVATTTMHKGNHLVLGTVQRPHEGRGLRATRKAQAGRGLGREMGHIDSLSEGRPGTGGAHGSGML